MDLSYFLQLHQLTLSYGFNHKVYCFQRRTLKYNLAHFFLWLRLFGEYFYLYLLQILRIFTIYNLYFNKCNLDISYVYIENQCSLILKDIYKEHQCINLSFNNHFFFVFSRLIWIQTNLLQFYHPNYLKYIHSKRTLQIINILRQTNYILDKPFVQQSSLTHKFQICVQVDLHGQFFKPNKQIFAFYDFYWEQKQYLNLQRYPLIQQVLTYKMILLNRNETFGGVNKKLLGFYFGFIKKIEIVVDIIGQQIHLYPNQNGICEDQNCSEYYEIYKTISKKEQRQKVDIIFTGDYYIQCNYHFEQLLKSQENISYTLLQYYERFSKNSINISEIIILRIFKGFLQNQTNSYLIDILKQDEKQLLKTLISEILSQVAFNRYFEIYTQNYMPQIKYDLLTR
ncbi:transmembrane protein, putative (macronuclear) [Tetrahymena thermophila SB210]|uniref:Transmembrane protein, putative n=1 Tax=Tetrahymena thermophila (strain SB210) TaxID=312017 RepID=W7X9R6_TETTS|nr:transmembrane protein, putative [Tetrahymena thermophila SB210]EWS74082.1 transmembrane protein, putative [Tetrahymena thermophila SB210]|eukprot:XP_012653415.1 transmembrane protein, putative [Tetrahymena thermophila SB210]